MSPTVNDGRISSGRIFSDRLLIQLLFACDEHQPRTGASGYAGPGSIRPFDRAGSPVVGCGPHEAALLIA